MADDSTQSVTIRAELLNEVSGPAREAGSDFGRMATEIRESATGAGDAVEKLGTQLDQASQKAAQDAEAFRQAAAQQRAAMDAMFGENSPYQVGGPQPGYKLADLHSMLTPPSTSGLKDLAEQGGKVTEMFSGIGEAIKYKVQYPMYQLNYAIEGGITGMITWGLVTESSIQKANLALSAFTGSSGAGGAAFAALHGMEGPVPLAGLESGLEGLMQAGMSQSQATSLLGTLNNLSAVSLNPTNSLTSMSSAIANMQMTGLLNSSDVNAFSGAGVNIFQMLAQETGQSPDQLRRLFAFGGQIATPSSFMTDLSSSPNATTGLSKYRQTWSGEFEQMKKDFGDVLAVFETPLGNALTGASKKIDKWSTDTADRFKTTGGSLGAEWKSGDMKDFGATLANIFGDPKMAGDITAVAGALRSLDQIITHDLVPIGRDLFDVVDPAFKLFADVLGVMADHRTATEAMIVTLGGFVILSKIATWANSAATAIRGLTAAEEASASQKAIAGLQGSFGLAESPSGYGITRGLVKGAGAIGGVMMGYQGYQGKGIGSDLELVGGGALTGATIGSIIPGVGTGIGAVAGGIVGGGIDIFRHLEHSGGESQPTIHVSTMNVNVPGTGNPEKVANGMPKAINDQTKNYQAMQVRRTGGKVS